MSKDRTYRYIAPFLVFIAFLALDRFIPLPATVAYPVRFAVVGLMLLLYSRPVIDLRATNVLGSIVVGIAAFVIWVGPDVLWPAYREHWLFQNAIMGSAKSTADPALKSSWLFIVFRVASSVINVPILEELFWRGWMMRWLIKHDFESVPMGTYAAQAFWVTAVLFASEHGSYWEVGLITGALYNYWLVRTKNLANCILAHAVTNALLAVFVLYKDQWQYWL